MSESVHARMTGGGEVLLAGSAGYESARRSQIARFDSVRPRVVVRCRASEDVAHAIALARSGGLPLALRSGGHCFAGRSSTTGVVIDVSGMGAVAAARGGGGGGGGAARGRAGGGGGARVAGGPAGPPPRGRAGAGGGGRAGAAASRAVGGGGGVRGLRHAPPGRSGPRFNSGPGC